MEHRYPLALRARERNCLNGHSLAAKPGFFVSVLPPVGAATKSVLQ